MKKVILWILITATVLSLAGCTAGPNDLANITDKEGEIAGFWQGLWHGIITPVTFVISLFNSKISIYEVYNNGGWYDFGYLIGVSIIFGGSGGSAGKRSRKK